MKTYRQGDVVISKINTIPEIELKEKEDLILAEGEVTGHYHKIVDGKVKLMVAAAATKAMFEVMILRVLSDQATLFHDEHESIILTMGDYEIKQQREWDWFNNEARRVLD